ncbi:hypothetical protein GMA8713_05149 [Grimontia marina]|uniref:RanBP2-type domain-containing protein n=1 Tax=Grimontia marina TaxID=646534 RepID=A0A128FJY6_9GAMM|nr:hypothetical protein GMA8713_05149 [Grimontia marina]
MVIKYNWVCNQCQHVNMSGTDSCVKCGCSAYANPDEILARKDPEEFKFKELKKYIESKAVFFLIAPGFIILFFYNGQALYFTLWLVSLNN